MAARKQSAEVRPYLVSTKTERAPRGKARRVRRRFEESTLGDLGITVGVGGFEETDEAEHILVIPYEPETLVGLDRATVKVFRYDRQTRGLKPLWNSGINLALGYVWAKVQQAGVYVPIGLPRDRLLYQTLRAMAAARARQDVRDRERTEAINRRFLGVFRDADPDTLDLLRRLLTRYEVKTDPHIPLEEYNFGEGGHPAPFHLPRGADIKTFTERLERLHIPPGGLPEEQLFQPPELFGGGDAPWAAAPAERRFEAFEWEIRQLPDLRAIDIDFLFPWLISKDWPMYQHDARHTGAASGVSSINAATVSGLKERFTIPLDGGPINTKPSIVAGKAYIGTTQSNAGPGGTLYKVDLCKGSIEGAFPTSDGGYYSIAGIGGSPAIYRGRVYFTTVGGKVYCVDAASMTKNPPHPPALWITDLKNASAAKKQPVNNANGDCWSSPLVVDDKVYVGSGEGESSNAGGPLCWGFIWCLNADNGKVLWLFCTNKAVNINSPGSENQPNQIPRSAAVSDPLPGWATAAGFSIIDDPAEDASSPWSSFAYDHVHQQVYVGTGNSRYIPQFPHSSSAPDQRYGSGLIALDAHTGQFRGFHTSQPDDSYHPNDADIDVPGAPTVFSRGGQRVVCYGSKNGSLFLLDGSNLQVLGGGSRRRQLLARANGTGHPGNRGTAIAGVATGGGLEENRWGVMATPALHAGLGIIYVGLGGYLGAGDGTKTPFIRAVDWDDLNDAWPTLPPDGQGVVRYSAAQPPVYNRAKEAALSSPAVVNDVVFVSTTDPGTSKMRLYALDAATGLCLWAAPEVADGGWPRYALGPAISGEYVVAGAGTELHIYTRPGTPWCLKFFPPQFDLQRILEWPGWEFLGLGE